MISKTRQKVIVFEEIFDDRRNVRENRRETKMKINNMKMSESCEQQSINKKKPEREKRAAGSTNNILKCKR